MKTAFADAARSIASTCTCLRARQVSRALSRLYDEQLRPSGLQISQLSVLVAVTRFGEKGASIGALARALVMERTTLTRNLRPLEKAGLLRVARDPADARGRLVLLTRAGERAIESAYPLWEQGQERLRAALGEPRVADLNKALSRAIEAAG